MVLFFYACYDDKGNYEYRDINEITVEGIDASYARDVDDSLRIYPVLSARCMMLHPVLLIGGRSPEER